MKTTDLFDSRSPVISTRGLNVHACSFCELRVDAGFTPEDPDHSRGYVRLELDRESEQRGGIATRVLRASAVRDGQLKDVLEFHTKGDCETAALARALIFAANRLLHGLDDPDATTGLIGDWKDEPTPQGILRDSPSGSVFQGDWNE